MPDSAAARAGIRQHDVLVKLDGKRLTTVEAANALIQEIKDRSVPVALMRAGAEISLEVAPRLTNETSYRSAVMLHFTRLLAERATPTVIYQPVEERVQIVDNVQMVAEPAPAAEQIAALKRQLAEIQKSLEALEASLRRPAEAKK